MNSTRAFRFGVVAASATSAHGWRDLARKAEDLGYSSLLLPDHFSDQFGPLVAMAAAAASTRTLRVGTNVLDNDFRHPAVLAKEIATLDVLSGGRVELGVGAGWQVSDYERTGLSFDPPGIRFERLREAVHVLKGLFGASVFNFQGRHYAFRDYESQPKPIQSPLPITLGAGAPRMLALAAREADVVNLVPRALRQGGMDLTDTSAKAFDGKVARIRSAAPDRMSELEIATLVHRVLVTETAGEADDVASRAAGAFSTTQDAALESPLVLIGSVSYMVDKLWERQERFGLTYLSVLAHNLEAFAPVVSALAGRAAGACPNEPAHRHEIGQVGSQ